MVSAGDGCWSQGWNGMGLEVMGAGHGNGMRGVMGVGHGNGMGLELVMGMEMGWDGMGWDER